MSHVNRLKRLESVFSPPPGPNPDDQVPIEGKSRTEVAAICLCRIYCQLEAAEPGVALAYLKAAEAEPGTKSEHEPLDQAAEIVAAIRNCQRWNPGLPRRLLEAILRGDEEIGEEIVFPDGRPEEDKSHYDYRHGELFSFRPDAYLASRTGRRS